MKFNFKIFSRDFLDVLNTDDLTFSLNSYSSNIFGGPSQATLTAYGNDSAVWNTLNLLRKPIKIYDEFGQCVWWGFINSVSVNTSGTSFSADLDLDQMFNKVKVMYNLPEVQNSSVGDTMLSSWAQDDESISVYGTKEYITHLPDMTTERAEARRDLFLSQRKYPVVVPDLTGRNASQSATITCKGWSETLKWVYFEQLSGIEKHDPSSGTELTSLGLGFTSTNVSFELASKYISQINGEFLNFEKGDKIRVSNSSSNDGIYTIDAGTDLQPALITTSVAPTVTFGNETHSGSTLGHVYDSGSSLVNMNSHDLILIGNTTNNNGYKIIDSAGYNDSELTLTTTVTAEGPIGSVTFTRGNKIQTVEALVTEMPSATVTVTNFGQTLAQSFSLLYNDDPWSAKYVYLKLKKVGSPTDDIVVTLYADASGSPVAPPLAWGSIAGSSLSDEVVENRFILNTEVPLVYGTTYWFIVSRSGANDWENFYKVSADMSGTYPRGVLYYNDGSAYRVYDTPRDLVFKITGERETTDQVSDILDQVCEFITSVRIQDHSGLYSNQYRDGSRTAYDEIKLLVETGTSANERVMFTVNEDRSVDIYKEPTNDHSYFLEKNGFLVDKVGTIIDNYKFPYGKWVNLKDIVPITVNLINFANINEFFIDEVEYTISDDQVRVATKSVADPFDFSTLE